MVNFLGRYMDNLSMVMKPMTDLLSPEMTWIWGKSQQNRFDEKKKMIIESPTLVYYDPNKPTTVSADSSSCGLGGVLLQMHEGKQKPVAYCSRTLEKTECKLIR